MTINIIAQIVEALICGAGILFVFFSMVDFARISKAAKINGKIVDFIQEYTSRGFIWKMKISYENNGDQCFHIMKTRTLKRGSQNVTIYIDKNGDVLEKHYAIERLLVGIFAIALAIVVSIAIH